MCLERVNRVALLGLIERERLHDDAIVADSARMTLLYMARKFMVTGRSKPTTPCEQPAFVGVLGLGVDDRNLERHPERL